VLIAYNAAIQVWPMVGLNVVLSAINVWHLWAMLKTRHDQQSYTVVEVGTDDDFLAHMLRVYASDIARLHPGFTWPPHGPNRCAFVVMHGDEVVGVVLVHAEGPDVARVELDYVTPKYRDFTPGEFVYRRSQLFTNRGFRTVIAPPGMTATYYAWIGFQREGDVHVLQMPEKE
jgi:hypothetical protein